MLRLPLSKVGLAKNIQGHDGARTGPLKLGGNGQQIAVARDQHLRFASYRQVHERQVQRITAIGHLGWRLRYAHGFESSKFFGVDLNRRLRVVACPFDGVLVDQRF